MGVTCAVGAASVLGLSQSVMNNAFAAAAAAVSQIPGARLALVGDGPQRQELEQMFSGMPVKFMVSLQLHGSAQPTKPSS